MFLLGKNLSHNKKKMIKSSNGFYFVCVGFTCIIPCMCFQLLQKVHGRKKTLHTQKKNNYRQHTKKSKPGTISALGTLTLFPSLNTTASLASYSFNFSIASSADDSCHTPTIAFAIKINKITPFVFVFVRVCVCVCFSLFFACAFVFVFEKKQETNQITITQKRENKKKE